MKACKQDRLNAVQVLRQLISPGDTIRIIVRHRSRSGLTRYLSAFILQNGEVRRITWSACAAMDRVYNPNHEAVEFRGYGYSAVQEFADDLSYALFGDVGKLEYETV